MTETIQRQERETQEKGSHKQAAENSRRERRMNRRRREVLEVAARLFAQVGYEATTLEMIASEMGLSKPGLYYYIKSKEDVLVQIHEDVLHSIIEGVRTSISPEMPPDERLWRLIVAHIVSHCSHPASKALVLFRGHLDSGRAQEVVALRDRYQKFVEAILQEGIEQGIFQVTNAKLAAFTLLGALNWIPNWYSPQGPLSLEEIGEYFANILVGGLITPTSSFQKYTLSATGKASQPAPVHKSSSSDLMTRKRGRTEAAQGNLSPEGNRSRRLHH